MCRHKLTFLLFLCYISILAQKDMQPGFLLLENGQFQEAETFFKSILESEPENKTAKICYGRAVGLNGAPEKANTFFSRLVHEYPNDFEIAINYNESFLWAKDYEIAKPLYK